MPCGVLMDRSQWQQLPVNVCLNLNGQHRLPTKDLRRMQISFWAKAYRAKGMLEAVELLVKLCLQYNGLDGKQFQGCFQALSNCWLLGGQLLFARQIRGAGDVQVDPEIFT